MVNKLYVYKKYIGWLLKMLYMQLYLFEVTKIPKLPH